MFLGIQFQFNMNSAQSSSQLIVIQSAQFPHIKSNSPRVFNIFREGGTPYLGSVGSLPHCSSAKNAKGPWPSRQDALPFKKKKADKSNEPGLNLNGS